MKINNDLIKLGKKIWTNPNPTSNFGAQTITLSESLDNYEYYEILFRQTTNTARIMSTGRIPVGNGTILFWCTSYIFWRPTDITVSGSSISFEKGRKNNGDDNTATIPMYVIAYKH